MKSRVKMLLFHCYTQWAHLAQIHSVFRAQYLCLSLEYMCCGCNLYTENIHLADCRGSAYTWKPSGRVPSEVGETAHTDQRKLKRGTSNPPSSPEQGSAESKYTLNSLEPVLENLLLSLRTLFLGKHARIAEIISGIILNSQVKWSCSAVAVARNCW